MSMKVPLTIDDFLRRGAQVYGDRPALVDEPGTAGSLGTITYRSVERRARGVAIALDQMGVGVGERVAIVSPNAARFGILFLASAVTAGSSFRSTTASTPMRSATWSSTRVPLCCSWTP